jgi:hypothetical protein
MGRLSQVFIMAALAAPLNMELALIVGAIMY